MIQVCSRHGVCAQAVTCCDSARDAACTWKLRIHGCCSICRTVGRPAAVLFRPAEMNCLAGSEILLGNEGDDVHMADWMLASEAPAAAKGALQDNMLQSARQVANRRQLVNMFMPRQGQKQASASNKSTPLSG